jgi:TRAP-type C4-dicarboxylate transport system permease small subunit
MVGPFSDFFLVIGRFLFNRPIHGVTEITEFFMVSLLYFTLPYTQALKAHINVEIFTLHYSPRNRLVSGVLTYFLGLFVFALITWQGIKSAADAWKIQEVTFGLLELPLFPAKILVPIGSFFLCSRFVLDIVEGLRKLAQKDFS